jgi:hypothetical protein
VACICAIAKASGRGQQGELQKGQAGAAVAAAAAAERRRHPPSSSSSRNAEVEAMPSTTDFLLRHSIASAVSGVTERTPSATGGPLSLVEGPPAVSASRSRACELLELLDDMAPLYCRQVMAGAGLGACGGRRPAAGDQYPIKIVVCKSQRPTAASCGAPACAARPCSTERGANRTHSDLVGG